MVMIYMSAYNNAYIYWIDKNIVNYKIFATQYLYRMFLHLRILLFCIYYIIYMPFRKNKIYKKFLSITNKKTHKIV